MRISFLHTIDANQAIFEQAANDLGLSAEHLHHEVRADLRVAVQLAGGITSELRQAITRCLLDLSAEADAVVVTCATLGPAVDGLPHFPIPIVRADAALASAAAKAGGSVVVLCAAESAIESTRRLFETFTAAANQGPVTVVHVPRVWALFSGGDFDACLAETARAAERAYDIGATVVAFAHPWMAPAVSLIRAGHVALDSPRAALRAVMQ
ncbi:arylsulfatase [Trinickia violacea]|uniref:Arylsulfatase n=1 Tax=Trinickia violacea TaxID=2571746 RepID=A0A4P8IU64_9BURK|nr:arylsulfatase [Trinickia violacea]QCP52622.1 arylsulfatase [Trinickia violacea]